MQFKNPKILYFLGLLLIPILIHLFQLQRFVKIPFTNVAFLKKISIETRKSSKLKKYLILLMRLLALASLVIAFAQPYFSNVHLAKKQHIFVYVDNSLSTTAKGEKGNLLAVATQEIIENCPKNEHYSLLTNDDFYKNIDADEFKQLLRTLKPTTKRINFEEISLKMNQKVDKNTIPQNILISDFQNITENNFKGNNVSIIQLRPVKNNNVSIDSVYISEKTNQIFKIAVKIKNVGNAQKNIPISIYNDEQLVSKQIFDIEEDNTKLIQFSIQKKQVFLGKLKMMIDDCFKFDNDFIFSINAEEKINVMAVGEDNQFLSKIYTDGYEFKSFSEKNIQYNLFDKQELLILNGLEYISKSLSNAVKNFTEKGGNLIVIPSAKADLSSYNFLLNDLKAGRLKSIVKDSLKITKIHFSNPIFRTVFDKKVHNFQYPIVKSYIKSKFRNILPILSFDNEKPFVATIPLKNSDLIWFSSDLQIDNSNFKNSPLIVPLFYNIGQQSLKLSKLYYRLDEKNTIDINKGIDKNAVLELANPYETFIPIQKKYQNKISLNLENQPNNVGFYKVKNQNKTLKILAFNPPKEESNMAYFKFKEKTKTIKNTFEKVKNTTKVNWLWKWFLVLVIVFLLLEILILKYFKI